MNTKKSQVSSTNQGWEGERQEEITVMVKGGGGGEESLHSQLNLNWACSINFNDQL